MSPLKYISICVCVVVLVGYIFRRRRGIHVPAMLTAFIIDMSVVAYIEVTRDALASAKAKMGPLMVVHLIFSISVVVLYFGQIATGLRKLKGGPSWWHKRGATLFLLSRFGNLFTSFWVT